jgi:predicted ATP-grasp superfamily ATP-dependent carboligase
MLLSYNHSTRIDKHITPRPLNVLIFEYVTGGGFSADDVPESLASEGKMMVEALLSNFAALQNIDVCVMKQDDSLTLHENVRKQIQKVDAVWVIAPEFDGILETFCSYVEKAGKKLLTSPSHAVAIAANKFDTFKQLEAAQIPTVPTELFNQSHYYDETCEWIIKPIDGAGAENTFLITSPENWKALPSLGKQFIIQPHIDGDKLSLSCIFEHGDAILLCVNLQVFDIQNRCFHLQTIQVNEREDKNGDYQKIASQVAKAFPDLWGYVGIDLIQTAQACLVLEINPRLTTSFAQIESKLGINVAKMVMSLCYDSPLF